VASLTSSAKLTIVRIILQVTPLAVVRHIHFLFDRFTMTDITHDTFVFACQFEIRLFVMIKLPGLPVTHVVAQVTLGTKAAFMHIIAFMTR
jgi:hypothetical protein